MKMSTPTLHARITRYPVIPRNPLGSEIEVRSTGWSKKLAHFLYGLTSYALTSLNIEPFSNLFHYLNQEGTCNNTIIKIPPLHYLVKCQCLKSNNRKQDDFYDDTFKEINNRKQRVYCLKVSHSAAFTSNVRCVRLAGGRRTLKNVLLQKSSCFQLLLLRHWHFAR